MPGGTRENLQRLEAEDRQTLIDAMREAGGYCHSHETADAVARLATWAFVDQLRADTAQAEGLSSVHYGWIDMEQMRRTA